MNFQKIKEDKNNANGGARKLIVTLTMFIGAVLSFIAFITFVLWLATKDMFQ